MLSGLLELVLMVLVEPEVESKGCLKSLGGGEFDFLMTNLFGDEGEFWVAS